MLEIWRGFDRLVPGFRRLVVLVAVLSLGQAAVLAPTPFLVRRVLDDAVPGDRAGTIVVIGVALVVLNLAATVLGWAARRATVRVAASLNLHLRCELVAKLHGLPASWRDEQDPGLLHSTVVHDVERLGSLLQQSTSSLVPAVVVSAALLVVAFVVEARLATVVVVLLVLALLATQPARRRSHRWGRAFHGDYRAISATMRVVLRGLAHVSAHGAEDAEQARLDGRFEEMTGSYRAFGDAQATYATALSLVAGVVGSVVLVLGGMAAAEGSTTVGSVVSFYAIGALLLRQVSVALPGLTAAMTDGESLRRVEELLGVDLPRPYQGRRRVVPTGAFALEGVSFGYPGGGAVLTDFDLHVAAGERVALIGPNGTGKSTLVSLLLGLHRPDAGRVTFDGIPLDELDVAGLRREIGMVLQDPVLVPGTIAANVAFGRPGVGTDEVAAAFEQSGTGAFLESLPAGTATQVGDEGLRLSGGQRQRVALARALVGCPPLLLLDEPTTYLDVGAVDALLERLDRLPARPTVLLVTHDPAVAARADRVVSLAGGPVEVP